MESIIGIDTKIWHYTNIYNSLIGKNCNIGSYCEISGAKIGNNVRIGAFGFICEGVEIQDNVFIAPRVTILHDKNIHSGKGHWQKVLIKKNAKIGACVTILPGLIIGENAIIGAGSVVTKNIDDNSIVYGNPAKIRGKNDKCRNVAEIKNSA